MPEEILYMVGCVQKETPVQLAALGIEQEISLTWADGMVGVIPVFESREAAEKYADGKIPVMEVVMEKKDD